MSTTTATSLQAEKLEKAAKQHFYEDDKIEEPSPVHQPYTQITIESNDNPAEYDGSISFDCGIQRDARDDLISSQISPELIPTSQHHNLDIKLNDQQMLDANDQSGNPVSQQPFDENEHLNMPIVKEKVIQIVDIGKFLFNFDFFPKHLTFFTNMI